jgi:hypothetical protein
VRNLLKSQIRIRQAALMGGLLCFVVGFAAVPMSPAVLTVSGSPLAMKITTATAGFPPNSATDATTTYTVKAKFTTSPLKILASLSSIMPPGMTLTVFLVAPSAPATSNGAVTLSTSQLQVVGNITTTVLETNTITYTLSATAAAGVVTVQSTVVTFTLLAWP